MTDSSLRDTVRSAIIVANNPKVNTGKMLFEDSTYNITARAIRGKMLNKDANRQIKPLMQRYFAIYKTLKPADTLALYNYRMNQLSKLVDLKSKA